MPSLFLISLSIACNPPEGKDTQTILSMLQATEEPGVYAAGFGAVYTASEEARAYDNELSINLGTIVRDDETVDMEMLVIGTLEDSWSEVATTASPDMEIVMEADLLACEDSNMELLDDGSCQASYAAIIGGSSDYSIVMGFEFRSQSPEGEPETEVTVSVEAEEAQAE